jgi:cobalt/nickel transport system permease protein
MSSSTRTVGLYIESSGPIHRAPAHLKVLVLLIVMLAVVAIPVGWVALFVAVALAALVLAGVARVPASRYLALLVIEIPFLVFIALMPFVASGPRIEVLGLSLATAGLVGAWSTWIRATIGLLLATVLAATTTPSDLLAGLRRLRMPEQLAQIIGFMFRYASTIAQEFARMRVARESRGFRARSIGSWGVIGRAMAAMFVRSYARSERVHLAMLARGYVP